MTAVRKAVFLVAAVVTIRITVTDSLHLQSLAAAALKLNRRAGSGGRLQTVKSLLLEPLKVVCLTAF
jgi:hypothetical protein